ncbi:hypothetical protein ACVWXO_000593 [Bradyrhizobium sp. LM2.7]
MPRQRLAGRTSLEQIIHLKLVRPLQIGRAPEFVGEGRDDRGQNPAVCRDDCFGIHRTAKTAFWMLGFRRIEWCTPNSPTCVRSQQPLGGPKHPKPTHPLQGQHKCHWSKRSQATPLLPNASTPTIFRRRSRPKRMDQSGGSGRAISPRAGPDPRRPCHFYSPRVSVGKQHTLPADELRRRRERIGPSGRDELCRPTYFPVSKLTAQYAQIVRSRAAKQTCQRKTT